MLIARVWRDRNGRIGMIGLGLLIIIGLLGGLGLMPHDPVAQQPDDQLTGPSATYWLGTDQFGRDIAARVADGIWTSLRVAIAAVVIAVLLGSVLGIFAGFFRSVIDQVVSRFTDILFAFPAILLALAVVSALGEGWQNTAIAIAVVYTPIFARTARGPTLAVGSSEYIKAMRVLGIPTTGILLRHVLPNVAAPIVVQVTLAFSWAILTESSLSFLGLGTQPPSASLGLMVSDAASTMPEAWWTLVFPAAAIVIAVIALNLLGDGLRSALDPRGRDE
jgi:peptide/nickel transport system permease protein